jgi:hypothetical protein
MSTIMLWPFRSSLIAVTVMMVMAFHTSAQADSSKTHRGLCAIHYPSDAMMVWDCWTMQPGESLEALFGEYWIDVARFNRIDRRHARPGLSIKVPRLLKELKAFAPLPLSCHAAEQFL